MWGGAGDDASSREDRYEEQPNEDSNHSRCRVDGARGGYVYSDFLPEFESGTVTIAVKSFLRYTYHVNKPAPPRGHLSVWMESVKLPAVVLDAKDGHNGQ